MIDDLVAAHPSGVGVLVLASGPLKTSLLDPTHVAAAIGTGRRTHDVVIIDLHPDYEGLNRAIFELADRILVPVTPDMPALRAAVQLRDVATELGFAVKPPGREPSEQRRLGRRDGAGPRHAVAGVSAPPACSS